MQVTVNGKTVKAVQGQSLREAVRVSGAKIEYGCEKVRRCHVVYPRTVVVVDVRQPDHLPRRCVYLHVTFIHVFSARHRRHARGFDSITGGFTRTCFILGQTSPSLVRNPRNRL